MKKMPLRNDKIINSTVFPSDISNIVLLNETVDNISLIKQKWSKASLVPKDLKPAQEIVVKRIAEIEKATRSKQSIHQK